MKHMYRAHYLKGALFLILASVISAANDAIMKYTQLSATDTLFLRFFFATLFLVPLVIWNRKQILQASVKPKIHILRALIFGSSMYLFLLSLKQLPLALVTAINFSIPIWVIILAKFLLKEDISKRMPAVLISLVGIIITYIPVWESGNMMYALFLILGTIGFASLDVLNKHLMNKNESMLMMLFGSSFGISLLYLPFFSFSWPSNWYYFALLGVGANLLLWAILQAWKSCDISAIQPIKYIEFPIALYLGSALFKDTSSVFLFIGVGILITGILINIRNEFMKQ